MFKGTYTPEIYCPDDAKACTNLFPIFLLRAGPDANVCTPRPERWPRHGCLQGEGENLDVAWNIHTLYAGSLAVMWMGARNGKRRSVGKDRGPALPTVPIPAVFPGIPRSPRILFLI